MREVIHQSVITCACCGQDHARLAFAKFAHQPITDADGTVWGWWATCLITGEPVLLRIAEHPARA